MSSQNKKLFSTLKTGDEFITNDKQRCIKIRPITTLRNIGQNCCVIPMYLGVILEGPKKGTTIEPQEGTKVTPVK